jgi:hypothetical protein
MGNPITDLISHIYNYGSFNEGQPNQVKTDQLPPEAKDIVAQLGQFRDTTYNSPPNTQKLINMLYNPKTRSSAIRAFHDPQVAGSDYYSEGAIDKIYDAASNPTRQGYTPDNLPMTLSYYRSGTNPKNTSPDGLETRPSNSATRGPVDTERLYNYARGMSVAKKLGLTSLTPQEFAAFALKEGRSDLGNNGVDYSNPKKTNALMSKLTEYVDPQTAEFIALVQEKTDVAKRKGITLQEAWNGTGKSTFGISGKQYSQDWNNHLKAVNSPKNKQLLDFINRAYRGE